MCKSIRLKTERLPSFCRRKASQTEPCFQTWMKWAHLCGSQWSQCVTTEPRLPFVIWELKLIMWAITAESPCSGQCLWLSLTESNQIHFGENPEKAHLIEAVSVVSISETLSS